MMQVPPSPACEEAIVTNTADGRLKGLEEILILPEATPGSEPSWFGFPVMLRDGVDAKRVNVTHFLDQNKSAPGSCSPATLQ